MIWDRDHIHPVSRSDPCVIIDDDSLKARLAQLREEHRDLDAAIDAMTGSGAGDPLASRRLKKRKLALKDEISRIEDQLLPDIIA